MKYVATVEIEFETLLDPLDTLRRLLNKLDWPGQLSAKGRGYADHCRILVQPHQLEKPE